RVGDMVARLGGDEFAMWLEEISLEKAIEKAEAMQLQCAEISKEMAITDPSLSFSIGIAMAKGEDREFLDDLLAKADAAMYEVKARGKGTFSVAGTAGEDGRNDA
ncbi:MAG: GGDEF domain-containing protein, partial [Sneathiella sp.]